MKTELWIDLEGTIIPDWSAIDEFINMDKLQFIINEHIPQSIGIYSYAIWNHSNYNTLRNSNILEHLSDIMDESYISVKTTIQMANEWYDLHYHKHLEPSATEIWKLPKEFAFLMSVNYAIKQGSDTQKFILFDDTAPHNKHYNINGIEVLFLNPANM